MRDTQHPSSPRHDVGEPRLLSSAPSLASPLSDEEQRERPGTLRDLFARVGNTCKKPVERAKHIRDTTAVIRLSDEASVKVDTLIQAGVFKTRRGAAAFLVEEGIKARDSLFRQAEQQIDEIKALRSELTDRP